MYVAGFMLSKVVAEPYIQPLNSSVVFVKETEVVFTCGIWRVVLNIDLSTYHEVLSTVRADLFSVEQLKKEFTPISELKQIENFFEHFGWQTL